MSHALINFLKAWAETRDAARIVSEGPTLPELAEAETYLNTLTPEMRKNIEAELEEALVALEDYLVVLKTEKNEVEAQLNNAEKVTKACLSYARTPQKIDLSE